MEDSELLTMLRQMCLNFPEVKETVRWGHPTFLAGKKMFAVLDRYEDRPCIAFRASAETYKALLADGRFFEAPYSAKYGWLCMLADGSIDHNEVMALLRTSYTLVALKRMLKVLDDSP